MGHVGSYLLFSLGILVISKTFAFKIVLLLVRHLSKRRSDLNSLSYWGDEVKAVDCSCGYRVEGINEQELIDQLQIHVDRDHQESRFTDEQIREMVASRVYAAERSRDVRQTG